jgi:hypothetical protein
MNRVDAYQLLEDLIDEVARCRHEASEALAAAMREQTPMTLHDLRQARADLAAARAAWGRKWSHICSGDTKRRSVLPGRLGDTAADLTNVRIAHSANESV